MEIADIVIKKKIAKISILTSVFLKKVEITNNSCDFLFFFKITSYYYFMQFFSKKMKVLIAIDNVYFFFKRNANLEVVITISDFHILKTNMSNKYQLR